MRLLGVTNDLKQAHPQRSGKLLGEAWERIVSTYLSLHCAEPIGEPVRFGSRKPTDIVVGSVAIEAKYRFGSGDNSTISHTAKSGGQLKALGYQPVMLILRDDSLQGALNRFRLAGWKVAVGEDAFDFLADMCGGTPRLDDLLSAIEQLAPPN